MGEQRFLIASGTASYPHMPDRERLLARVPEHVRGVVELFETFGYSRVLPEIGADPTAHACKLALSRWFKSTDRTGDETVVVYYTGHGVYADDRTHFLATHDTDFADLDLTAIRTGDLARLMLTGSRVSRMLIVLDTCFAAGGSHDVAREAMRVDFAGDKELWVLASAQPKAEAEQGVFVDALVTGATSVRWHGTSHPFVQLPVLVAAINSNLAANRVTQQARLDAVNAHRGEFIVNRHFASAADSDDLSAKPQVVSLAIAQREEDRVHWLPKARGVEDPAQHGSYFKGRQAALQDLASWLATPHDGRTRIVTGQAGSGKSSVLARLLMLCDPERARQLPVAQSVSGSGLHLGAIDEKIHLRGKTLEQVVQRIAGARGLHTSTVAGLFDALTVEDSSRIRPLTLLLDALDEAVAPAEIVEQLLVPLGSRPHVRLLVGTRPELIPQFGPHVVLLDLDTDRYFERQDILDYARGLLVTGNDPRARSLFGSDKEANVVAEAIASAAGRVFLVARLIAQSLQFDEGPLETEAISRCHSIPAAFEFYLSRFRRDQGKVRDLLRPLAFARGNGLPWRDLWANLAANLSGTQYSNTDIEWLLQYAGAFITEVGEPSGSVYRLYHESLAEHLRDRPDHEVQPRIVQSLIAAANQDWNLADPYVRDQVATHAAMVVESRQLDALFTDVAFLVAADPDALLPVLPLVGLMVQDAGQAAGAYLLVAHRLRGASEDERASYLEMAAAQRGNARMRSALRLRFPNRRWSALWARWDPILHNAFSSKHHGPVNALTIAATATGRLVVSGGQDGVIRRWHAATGREFGGPIEAGQPIEALAVTARRGRQIIVAATEVGSPCAWDLESGVAEPVPFGGHVGGARAIVAGMLRGREFVASLGYDDESPRYHSGPGWRIDTRPLTIRAWYVDDARPLSEPIRCSTEASAFALGSHAGRPFVVVGSVNGAKIVDLETGTDVRSPLNCPVYGAAVLARDGQTVVAVGGAGTVSIWSLDGDEPYAETRYLGLGESHTSITVGEFAGGTVLVAHSINGVTFLDADDASPSGWPIPTTVLSCAAGPVELGSTTIAAVFTGDADGEIRRWESDEFFRGERRELDGVTTLGCGRYKSATVVVSGGRHGVVRVLDIATGEEVVPHLVTDQSVATVAVADLDGVPVVVAQHTNGVIRSYEIEGWREKGAPIQAQPDQSASLALLTRQPGARAVACDRAGNLCVWDLKTGQLIRQFLNGPRKGVATLAVCERDQQTLIASGPWSGPITLDAFDERGLSPEQHISVHGGTLVAVEFVEHADRILLAVATGDPRLFGKRGATVRLVDVETGAEILALQHHISSSTVWALENMRVGGVPVLASGDSDGLLAFSDLAGHLLMSIDIGEPVVALAAPSDDRIIVGTSNGIIALDIGRLGRAPVPAVPPAHSA